jgi:uncharacterized phiE125 gp8 family phage protein
VDDGGQDGLILRYLRAAILAVEARIGKALIRRNFRLRRTVWRDPRGEVFPVAPVQAVASLRLIARDGTVETVDPGAYALEPDQHRPKLVPTGWLLPSIPTGGAAEILFDAGFGEDWSDVPADLAQAVMLLTAQYHESRHGVSPGAAMPFGVMGLIERWRVVRTSAAGPR